VQVIDYLEAYAKQFEIRPIFGQEVTSIRWDGGEWVTATPDWSYRARCVVVATGYARRQVLPTWPGQTAYNGAILHSSDYRSGERFRGTYVLVVGFGNSGGEIAIDLWEHGAAPSLSVRGPVNIIPRDVFGLPVQKMAILLSRLPPEVADGIGRLVNGAVVGDYSALGLRRAAAGPLTTIARRGRIPLIDVGTVRLIRRGEIRVFPGIERFTETGVTFVDGRNEPFDAVVLATGYRPGLEELFPEPVDGRPGLYFCGFKVVATGMLREIGREAREIAAAISSASSNPNKRARERPSP
jgi:cation diffusion facilitator CzcD-associated flavoprotein CzcO